MQLLSAELASEDLKQWDGPQYDGVDNLTSVSVHFVHKHHKESHDSRKGCFSSEKHGQKDVYINDRKHTLNINRAALSRSFSGQTNLNTTAWHKLQTTTGKAQKHKSKAEGDNQI